MKWIAAAASFLLINAAHAEDTPSYDELMQAANTAFEAEDWSAVLAALNAAQEQRPYSQFLARNRILAHVMLDDFTSAQAIAERYANRGLSIRLTGHPAFETLTARAEFAPVAEKLEENKTPFGESATMIQLNDTDLLPESFVMNKKKDVALTGSVRTGRIVGLEGSFATAPGGVYGLEVIGKRLWAVASSAPPYENPEETPTVGLYSYSLKDRSLKQSIIVSDENALLGDLENTPAGIVASDSITPRLFILRKRGDTFEVFSEDPRFVNLQGLAHDRRRKKLFVADSLAGLFSVDMKSGVVTSLANPSDAHLGSIDGLYLYKGDLIGIQNVTTPQRIVRIVLNKEGDVAESLSVLVQNHPGWVEPTNGQIVGDLLYYVATSNWPAYDAEGRVSEDFERAPVRIMAVPLNE